MYKRQVRVNVKGSGQECPLHTSRFLRFAFQRAIEGLIESGFRALVFRLRDLALPAFDFQLEEFFFQGIEKHGRGTCCRGWPNTRSSKCGRGPVFIVIEMRCV